MARARNIAPILERFERRGSELPGAGLSGKRSRALEAFANGGFPTPRSESWKYTNLDRLARTDFDPIPAAADGSIPEDYCLAGAYRIVIVNGRFAPDLSTVGDLPAGVFLAPLSASIEDVEDELSPHGDGTSLVALNTAFMRDGLVLKLSQGAVPERPVQVLHVTGRAGISTHPRTLVVAEAESRTTVVETFVGNCSEGYWTNAVTELRIAAGARVSHVKLQAEAASAYHTALTRVGLGRDSGYDSTALGTGAALSRNETRVAFEGTGSECNLRGGLLLRGRQHGDNTTEADHRVPHTSSRQIFRNALDDAARAVFQGGVVVRKDAQKTDSSQSSRSLLLAPGTRADAKPELRIFADDVKCAHGATVGDLDRNVLFYLQSRGIAPAEARALLIEAFVAEIVEGAPKGAARDHLAGAVSAWMKG